MLGPAIDAFRAETRAAAPTVRLQALPSEITSHVDWPLKSHADAEVVVILRESVTRLRCPRLSDQIEIDCRDLAFRVVLRWFRTGPARRFLLEHGWQLA